MNDAQIDLNLLILFRQIVQEGNLTRAATQLGISQPAASNSLRRLRRALDDPLFVRSTQGMQPTPRAQQLIETIAPALETIEAGLRKPPRFANATLRRDFTLLMPDFAEAVSAQKLLEEVRIKAPGVTLRFRPLAMRSFANWLENGTADLAVGFIPQPKRTLRRRHLLYEEFVCICGLGHPVISSALSEREYLSHSHVIFTSGQTRGDAVTPTLESRGEQRKIVSMVAHYGTITSIVANSDLLATVPKSFAQSCADSGKLCILPLPFPSPKFEVCLYWHERQQRDPGHRWLRDTCVNLFAQGPLRKQYLAR
jgi:DNA-binding transcriptional LysR family regulator